MRGSHAGVFQQPREWRVRRGIEKRRSVISRSPQENMEPSCPISFDIQNFLSDHFRSGENHEVPTLISRHPSSRQIQDASPSPWRAQQGEIHLFKIVVFAAQDANVPRPGQAPPLPPHERTVNLRLFSRLRRKFPFDKARFHARSFSLPQKPRSR